MYFRMTVTATTISRWWSMTGQVWSPAGAALTGLVIATPFVGLFVNQTTVSQAGEGTFDWVRFN
jgi:hypothetical protein